VPDGAAVRERASGSDVELDEDDDDAVEAVETEDDVDADAEAEAEADTEEAAGVKRGEAVGDLVAGVAGFRAGEDLGEAAGECAGETAGEANGLADLAGVFLSSFLGVAVVVVGFPFAEEAEEGASKEDADEEEEAEATEVADEEAEDETVGETEILIVVEVVDDVDWATFFSTTGGAFFLLSIAARRRFLNWQNKSVHSCKKLKSLRYFLSRRSCSVARVKVAKGRARRCVGRVMSGLRVKTTLR